MRTKLLLLAGLIAFSASLVDAQSVYLGPQIGLYKATDADNVSMMGGATCRLKLTPVLGAEASVNYRQENYLNDAVTVRSWPVMVTGLIYPIPFIYGAIGAGWYNVTFDYGSSAASLNCPSA
jgi:hypothetical protein